MLESKSSVLPFHHPAIIMAVRTGLEPVISRVTGERDNHYTNEPINGWDRGTRTRDISVNSRTLYRLSYIPIMVTLSGFEPEDVAVKGQCVNQFHHSANMEQATRIELVSQPWQGRIITIILCLH